jgi:hypothetical protein
MRRRTHYLSPKLRRVPFPDKAGYGLVATVPIAKGELLVVWGGKIVSRPVIDELSEVERSYVLQIEDHLFLLANRPIETAEYFNHSCDPNAGLAGQISLVAMRDIAPGEEVCFDYGMSESSEFAEFDCCCGAPNCRGRVRANDWLHPDLQARYRGFFSPYLQRRIDGVSVPLPAAAASRSRPRRVAVSEPAPSEPAFAPVSAAGS